MRRSTQSSAYANAEEALLYLSHLLYFWALMVILVVSVAVAVMGTVLMRRVRVKCADTALMKLYTGYHIFANMPVNIQRLQAACDKQGIYSYCGHFCWLLCILSVMEDGFPDNSEERDRIYLEKEWC